MATSQGGARPAWYWHRKPVPGTVEVDELSLWFHSEFNNGDQAGQAVAGAGDVSGDGKADLIIGAHAAYTTTGGANGGKAYLLLSHL